MSSGYSRADELGIPGIYCEVWWAGGASGWQAFEQVDPLSTRVSRGDGGTDRLISPDDPRVNAGGEISERMVALGMIERGEHYTPA